MPPWQHCCSQRKWWKLKMLTQPSWSIMIFEADTAIFRFSVWKNGGHGMRARPPGNQDFSILGRAVRGRSACGLDIPGTLGSIGSPGWNDVSTTYFPRRSQKMITIAHGLEFGNIDFKESKVWEQRGGWQRLDVKGKSVLSFIYTWRLETSQDREGDCVGSHLRCHRGYIFVAK